MNILSLNAGSSTLKYKLYSLPDEKLVLEGGLDHSGSASIADAAKKAIEQCKADKVDAIGHRVVHGGSRFAKPTLINADMVRGLREISSLDPLHNPTEVAMIEAGFSALPNVPAVAVFDTAFHQTMPEVAWRYAIPRDVADTHELRRYGFHGISYQYVSKKLLECLEREAQGTKLIICHMGNGASVCALQDGKSIDVSMGLTPLEGLVMGTRSGDVDPGILLYLMRTGKCSPQDIDDMLNAKSGLLGLSGRSGDVRDLEKAALAGDAHSELALEIFCYRAAKYIGAYAAALSGVDAIAFSGGIGEHSADIRKRICSRLEYLGVSFSEQYNNTPPNGFPLRITKEESKCPAWVIPTDEELQIARDVYTLVSSK